MLTRYSSRTDLAGVYRAQNDNPASYFGLDIANTDEPAGFTLPAFQVTIVRKHPPTFLGRVRKALDAVQVGWDPYDVYAKLALTRNAGPGRNRSVYLAAGIYETNGTFDANQARRNVGLRLANFLGQWSNGKSRVYLVVQPDIARRNKAAEEEHLADFIYAYDRTLHKAQSALEGIRGREFGPHDSEAEARAALLQAFLSRVPAPLRRLGMDMNAWGAEFLRLCRKSRDRDGRQWHSFGLEVVSRSRLPRVITPTYLTGRRRTEFGRVYLQLTRGVTEIGQHPPSEVITYG